jgi:hypothetical protein
MKDVVGCKCALPCVLPYTRFCQFAQFLIRSSTVFPVFPFPGDVPILGCSAMFQDSSFRSKL